MLFPQVNDYIIAYYGQTLVEGAVLEVVVPKESPPGPNDILKIEDSMGHIEYWVRNTLKESPFAHQSLPSR